MDNGDMQGAVILKLRSCDLLIARAFADLSLDGCNNSRNTDYFINHCQFLPPDTNCSNIAGDSLTFGYNWTG